MVSDEQKEACAISTMRSMLEDYSDDTGEPFDEALVQFAMSPVYPLLFDFETRLWAEGPSYLRSLFEEALDDE